MQGFLEATRVNVVADRVEAIRGAIKSSGNDSIILIAGKGHENYIDIMGVKKEYSDKKTTNSLLEDLI